LIEFQPNSAAIGLNQWRRVIFLGMGISFTSDALEIVMRLVIATLVGAALGLNREIYDKPAGMRTHALVTLGAALATMLCVPPIVSQAIDSLDALSRVIQGILTGIGFIGGGVILRDKSNRRIHGLTTAATIWMAASVGAACGAGYWLLVMVTAILTLIVLTFGVRVEKWANSFFEGKTDKESSD